MSADDLLRLILVGVPVRETQSGSPVFDATLEATGKHVVRSRQPLYDGARVLLSGGVLPDRLLTARHKGASYDSFKPEPVGSLARWTMKEGREHRLQRVPFERRPRQL